jgi:hypothetical protein
MVIPPGRNKPLVHGNRNMKDNEWIADLLRRGLLKASFIPPEPIRILRELSRYRTMLIQERYRIASIACRRT